MEELAEISENLGVSKEKIEYSFTGSELKILISHSRSSSFWNSLRMILRFLISRPRFEAVQPHIEVNFIAYSGELGRVTSI